MLAQGTERKELGILQSPRIQVPGVVLLLVGLLKSSSAPGKLFPCPLAHGWGYMQNCGLRSGQKWYFPIWNSQRRSSIPCFCI